MLISEAGDLSEGLVMHLKTLEKQVSDLSRARSRSK